MAVIAQQRDAEALTREQRHVRMTNHHRCIKQVDRQRRSGNVGDDQVEGQTAPGLPFLRLGNSNAVHQGQLVLAFGNPLGLESSVSMGIISSTGRQIKPDDTMVYLHLATRKLRIAPNPLETLPPANLPDPEPVA